MPPHVADPGLPFKSKRQIVGLDLIRVVAALLVVFFHLGVFVWHDADPAKTPAIGSLATTPFFASGWVGVEIFFVISGFVIAYSSEGATPLRFVRHRYRRLLPAALICATATCVFKTVVAAPLRQTSLEWLRSVVFFPVGPWIDGSYWTLPIEMAFYLLVFGNLLWRKGRYLPQVMATVGGLSAICCCVLLSSPDWVPASLLVFLRRGWFPPEGCLLLVYGTFFGFGVMCFYLTVHGATVLRFLMACWMGSGCVAEVIWHERGLGTSSRQPDNIALWVWAAAMLSLVVFTRWNARVQALAGERGMALIRIAGLTTYPLYLLHALIGEWLMRALAHRIGYGISLVLVVGFIIALAGLIALYPEPWLRQRLRILGSRYRSLSADSANH